MTNAALIAFAIVIAFTYLGAITWGTFKQGQALPQEMVRYVR